jgi:SpoVK/Ycf46/Vps4 family AAA+-type ATPase
LAIIILDDLEYGGGLHRGVGDRSSPAYSALSSALISEMDGIDDRGSKVLWAATVNRADLLDSALLRAGRFSKKISVPRPGPNACVQILLVHLRGVPLADGAEGEDLAEQVVQRLFSTDDDNVLLRVQYADSEHEEIFPPRVLNGAVLAESVRGAALRAVRRDRSNGYPRCDGIRSEDLYDSLDEQLHATVAAITPANAHLHYLGLPDDRRVVAVERVDLARAASKEMFIE